MKAIFDYLFLKAKRSPKVVYCDKCDNYKGENRCLITYKSSPIEKVPIYGNCREMNKYNNCNRYECYDYC